MAGVRSDQRGKSIGLKVFSNAMLKSEGLTNSTFKGQLAGFTTVAQERGGCADQIDNFKDLYLLNAKQDSYTPLTSTSLGILMKTTNYNDRSLRYLDVRESGHPIKNALNFEFSPLTREGTKATFGGKAALTKDLNQGLFLEDMRLFASLYQK